MGIKAEGGDINKPVTAPDVAQQPEQPVDSRLLEAQNLLGNMQVNPDSWSQWKPDGKNSAIRLNRINPAEFFPEIEELVTTIGGDELPQKSVLETFKSVWSSGVTMAATSPNENKDWIKHEQRGSQKHKKALIADLVRRLTRLMVGSRYHKNLEHYEPPQEFRKEVQHRILTASSKTDFLEKTKPIFSLVNKALAAQFFSSNKKPSSLDNASSTFFGSMHLSPGNIYIEGFPTLDSTGYTLSNFSKIVQEHKNGSPEENRRLEYNNPWLKDEELKGRILHLENRFADLNKIAERRSQEMKIVLPQWVDKKEQMGYNFLNSADFMKVALELIEEQIDYAQRNGDWMWQSVQAEEMEKWRMMWENQLRPTREKISVLDQEIDGLNANIEAIKKQTEGLSLNLEALQKIVASAKENLGNIKMPRWFGTGNAPTAIRLILEDLQTKVDAEIDTIKKVEPEAIKTETLLPSIESQQLRSNDEEYRKEEQQLGKDLKSRQSQKSDLETLKNEKNKDLETLQKQITDMKKAAEECLSYYKQVTENKQPGREGINLMLDNLKKMLSKVE